MDGLLIINKPKGCTSNDVVAKLRRILSVKKAGHTGTLDPDATGVLCVCIGKATRLAQYTGEFEKEYRVVMKLGVSTDTQDATGKVIKETRDFEITIDEIEKALKKFTGKIPQIPPMYSAVKVGGVPLYRLARKGKEILRKPREVHIKEIKLLDFSGIFARFDVTCSKGTYVRTLCADIGDYLGVGAHMYTLERIRSGGFYIRDAMTVDEVEKFKLAGTLTSRLISMEQVTGWMPSVVVKRPWDLFIKDGRPLDAGAVIGIKSQFGKGDRVAIMDSEEKLLAIGAALCESGSVTQGCSGNVLKVDKVLV